MGERDSDFFTGFLVPGQFQPFYTWFPGEDFLPEQNRDRIAPSSHAPRSGNPRLKQMVTYECGQAFVVP